MNPLLHVPTTTARAVPSFRMSPSLPPTMGKSDERADHGGYE